jgi:hypothetical protein
MPISKKEAEAMRDIGFDRLLAVLIGIPGLTVCVMAWVQPMDISERILAIAIGTIGFIWALSRGLSLTSIRTKVKNKNRRNPKSVF